MATTVEPTTRERTSATPAAAIPWYRDRNRQLAAAGIAVAVVALVAWFVVSSGRRKEEFAARSLNQARAAAEAGNLPLASSELQKLIQTYKGTDAAQEAVITLNQVRMVNGQSELAAVGLRDFLATQARAQVRRARVRAARAPPWRTPRSGRTPATRSRTPPKPRTCRTSGRATSWMRDGPTGRAARRRRPSRRIGRSFRSIPRRRA